ncbi:hypothetical protein A1Q2_08262 [Trichosporon asahii var. asahii CBS 8904]|uniref:Uncharacterized protein n=1 Tax=Trichosporon asahii var. asahii (strain CBS 8904) TaxID=1220162 RepID=K1V0A2_TRIAC|nr:hypothetical protein A1Q2_08262 [Trichosporon asahii var. asahii CBS 8904]
MTSDTVPASERPEPSPLTDYLAGMLRTPNQSHSLTPSDVEKSFDADRGLVSSPSSSSTPTTPATDRDRRKSRRQSTPFYTKGIPTSPGPPVTHLDLARAAEQRLKVPSTPTPMRSDRSPTSPSLSPSATPSSLPTPSPSRSPLSRPPVLRRPTDDGFTERFQYLVASSGLLEKTQILSLVSAQEEDNPPVPPEADDKLQMIVQSQQHRWDIYAASAFVIVSVLYVLGLSMLLVPSAAVAGGAALLLPSKSDSTSEMAKAPQVDSTEAAKEEPKPSEDSTTRVFNTLNALLAESRNLDQAIGTAMSLLAPRPDDLESGHSLRIALHRLFSDMTDSLAGTTSTLIPMADRSELAVLGDMYDIPVLGNRRRRASSSGSEGSTTTPVPHRQRSLSTSEAVTMGDDPSTPAAAAPDANDRFTPLPVRQLRHKRSESRGFDHSPAASPLRPYHSQHQREASVETRGNDGDEAMSVASSSTESSSLAPSSLPEQLNGARPPVGPASRAVMMSFTPKRASPLAHTGHTGHSLERPDAAPSSFPANAAPSSFPASARTTSPTSFHMRPSQSPFRRSLQDIPYIHTPPSSSAEQAAELAKARATSNMSSAKRRSLQTPYNLDLQREQTLVEANAGGLTRASSLQYTNRSAHSDALAALEGKRNVTEPVRSGLRPLTMSASLSTPNKRASSIWNTQISPPKSTPQQQVVESKSRNRNSIILESGSAGTAAMAQSEAMSNRGRDDGAQAVRKVGRDRVAENVGVGVQARDNVTRGTGGKLRLLTQGRVVSCVTDARNNALSSGSHENNTAEQAAELAKARATSNMSSAKRRSLQTPYNLDLQREQTLVEANAGGLTRASSLQYTNRSAHSDALAALEGKRNVTEPVRSGLRPLTMSASLSTPNKRASSIWNTQISPPKSTPQQQVVESKSRNRNSIILESGSAGTAAMAQSEAMSSRRSSTTLEGQTLLSSPDGSAASKRSSLLLDQGPAGKRVQQLLGEQNALGLGHSPRSASLGVHQPFQRVPSISPLTLGGLKASCHGVHLKRRRVACCLLGLRFAEPRSSSYWDDVCGEMQKLTEAMAMGRESLDSAREEAEKELSAQRALAESAKRHSSPAAPLGNIDDGPVEFAPRSDPMLSSVDELQRTLARVWARCDELRQRGVTLEPDILASIWADVRSDVGGMLRQVERGREAVRSTNVSEAGATDPTDSEIMPISASSADMEPGFLRAWEAVDQEEDEIERLVSGEDVPPDSEPYQEFLPPPGIDEVFEAAIPPAPAPRPKATLSRDERIKAAKEARARGAAMDRLTANSKEPPPEPEVRGQVMQELEGVFGVIRQRKGYSRQPAPESPATVPKESKPDSTPDSRISTPNSTPASARVTTPQSTSSAPRLVASPSRSPTVLSPVQPQFGLPQPQFGLPRIGSPTFRVTSPTSGRIGSPTPSSRVTSPTPSSRVSSPPPTAWSPRSAPRVLSPTSARMVSPPPGRMATMSPPLKSPSPISPRALSPTGPHTPSRSPSLSRQSSLTRASSLTRPGASGARKQKGMSLQPIAATVPLATSPDAERRRSLQTLYEGSNASGEFKPIHLRAPEEVAEDEIGVAL